MKPFLFFLAFISVSFNLVSQVSDSVEAPLTIVEKMPSFPGGANAYEKFLSNKLSYPAIEKEYGVQGRVFVTFIVEKDGSLSHIKILKGVQNAPALNLAAVYFIDS